MPTRLVHLVVDAADPAGLARFWSVALAWPVTFEEPDEVVIEPPDDDPAQAGQLPLVFVPVSEPKTSKNRVHLDVASTSEQDKAALVARLEALGARQIDIGQPDGVSWVVMADPEGNEFCVVSHLGSVGKDPASAFAGIGPVAAVVFDCMDPEAIALFWAEATGWPVLGRDYQGVWLRDDRGGGPYLDLHRVSAPKTAKLRVPGRRALLRRRPPRRGHTAPRDRRRAERHRPRRRPLDRAYRPGGQRVLRPHPSLTAPAASRYSVDSPAGTDHSAFSPPAGRRLLRSAPERQLPRSITPTPEPTSTAETRSVLDHSLVRRLLSWPNKPLVANARLISTVLESNTCSATTTSAPRWRTVPVSLRVADGSTWPVATAECTTSAGQRQGSLGQQI